VGRTSILGFPIVRVFLGLSDPLGSIFLPFHYVGKEEESVPTKKKIAEVADLTQRLQRSNAVVLMHYRELKVKEISELRGKLRSNNIEIKIAKNTLLRIAANNAGKPGLEGLFSGPTAVAFIYGSEPHGAKAVSDAVRAARKDNVKVTGGILGNTGLDAAGVERLTTMPTRDEQLASLMGTLKGPAGQLVATLNAPAQQLVYTLMAYRDKLQAQQA
jgi:large subunit ribosomal protein L10